MSRPRTFIRNDVAVIPNVVKHLGILCCMILLVSPPSQAQVTTGLPAFGSFSGGPLTRLTMPTSTFTLRFP